MPRALSVMLFTSNVPGCLVLPMPNLAELLVRDHAIGLCFVLHVVNIILLLVQPGGFILIQLPAGNALIDALLLIGLPLVDTRRLSLSRGHPCHQQCHPTDCRQHLLHHRLLQTWKFSPVATYNACGSSRLKRQCRTRAQRSRPIYQATPDTSTLCRVCSSGEEGLRCQLYRSRPLPERS